MHHTLVEKSAHHETKKNDNASQLLSLSLLDSRHLASHLHVDLSLRVGATSSWSLRLIEETGLAQIEFARGLALANLIEITVDQFIVKHLIAIVLGTEVFWIAAIVVSESTILLRVFLKFANWLQYLVLVSSNDCKVSQLGDLTSRTLDLLVNSIHINELAEAEALRSLEIAKR